MRRLHISLPPAAASALGRPNRLSEFPLGVACRDPPVGSSSRQADIEPSRPVRHDRSLRREDAPPFPLCARSACGASTAKRRVALAANLAEAAHALTIAS